MAFQDSSSEGFQSDQAGHGLVWTVLTTMPPSHNFFIPGTTGIVWGSKPFSFNLSCWKSGRLKPGAPWAPHPSVGQRSLIFCLALALGGFGNSLNQSWKMMKTDVDRWSFLEEVSPVADALSQGQAWTQVFFFNASTGAAARYVHSFLPMLAHAKVQIGCIPTAVEGPAGHLPSVNWRWGWTSLRAWKITVMFALPMVKDH